MKPAIERAEAIKAARGDVVVVEPHTQADENAALAAMMAAIPGKVVSRAEWDAQQRAAGE